MPAPKTPLTARAYLASRRLHRLFLDVCTGAFEGFWLGVLSRETHNRVTEAHYHAAQEYRTDRYNLGGLFPWETDMVDRYFRGSERLLVGGAGGGREMLALHELGFDVEGFECNEALVTSANQTFAEQGLDKRVELVAPDVCPVVEEPYDGCIVGWCAYMHIQDRSRRIEFLKSLRQAVKPDAPVLLSFWHITGDQRRRLRMVQRFANPLRRLFRREPIVLGDAMIPHRVQYFDQERLTEELNAAGFGLICYEPWFGHEYGHAVAMQDRRMAASVTAPPDSSRSQAG